MVPGETILSVDEAAVSVRLAQQRGEQVVMCHGCFDIVHPGHVRHLKHASRQGDRLLVTITGDRLVDKGTGRPLIPQALRAENLAALQDVDWVAINDRPTAVELLRTIRPDVYVKGREYESNDDPRFQEERRTVEQYGGRVVFTSGDVILSSSALIAALEQATDPAGEAIRRLISDGLVRRDTVDRILSRVHSRRVVVVGEVIRDTYVICDRPDVASEAPVMTLRPIDEHSVDGGAAIIARHLAALGARPTLVTAIPEGVEGETLSMRLRLDGVQLQAVQVGAPLLEKQRFLVGGSKVMKLDRGDLLAMDAADRDALVASACAQADAAEAAIIADFGLGLLTSATMSRLSGELRQRVSLLAGDVSGRRSNLMAMRQMDVICPSESEIRDAMHQYDEGLSSVVWRLLTKTESRAAIVTLGEEGLISFRWPAAEEGERGRLLAEHIPALGPPAVDELGCGDALLAATVLVMLADGVNALPLAGFLGGVAAAVHARRLGNPVLDPPTLRRGVEQLLQPHLTSGAAPNAVLRI